LGIGTIIIGGGYIIREYGKNGTENRTENKIIKFPVDKKYYCESQNDCVDGEYCEITEPGGCVSSEWWWEHVGNRHDCLPDHSRCKCINNKCEITENNLDVFK